MHAPQTCLIVNRHIHVIVTDPHAFATIAFCGPSFLLGRKIQDHRRTDGRHHTKKGNLARPNTEGSKAKIKIRKSHVSREASSWLFVLKRYQLMSNLRCQYQTTFETLTPYPAKVYPRLLVWMKASNSCSDSANDVVSLPNNPSSEYLRHLATSFSV